MLRSNTGFAGQVRDFADTIQNNKHPRGLAFQPKPGQLLVCHFGLGFQKPEIVKTRPVLVISPHQREWTKLCLVMPISSVEPKPMRRYHYKLPSGLIPGDKYGGAWLKGDLTVAVGCHRLDRFKVGFRQFDAPFVPHDVLQEARRCLLHAAGMHTLIPHW